MLTQQIITRRNLLAAIGSASVAAMGIHAVADEPAASSYRQKVLAKKPVAYWRLGEDKGEVAVDATGNGHDGAYHGGPTLGQPGAINHDADRSISLDGRGAYVEIPSHRDMSQPTSGKGLSVEVWMRPEALRFRGETKDPYVFWLGKGEAGRYEWAFRFYSDETSRPNRISAYIFEPAGGLGAGAYFQDKLKAGQWMHIVACFEPGDADSASKPGVHIYRNGEYRMGPPSPGTLYNNPQWHIMPAAGTAPLRLGTRNLTSFLRGGLDEVAIYPRVLTPEEIHENYLAAK